MAHRSRTFWTAVTLIMLSLAAIPSARPAHAQDRLCFPETNQCISGRFRQYWEQNGGLSIFGYPITAAANEVNPDTGGTYLTQWFERNRFELHPENAAPYDVLLGRLGADRLGQLGRNWQTEPRAAGPQAGCLWFAQTGHNVCDNAQGAGFMTYWRTEGLADPRLDAYGQSLALHGLPLTEARTETNSSGDTVTTQWFERGRFEWHPNNPPAFRVLLGLLGNEVRAAAASGLTTYTSPDGAWSVQYPANVLTPEDLGGGTIIFISEDRGTVAAVDSYVDQGNAYGNTGEGLRNRARDTLERIYGRPVNETGIIERPGGRWETGVSFTTSGGSKGEAVYEQRGRNEGVLRVNGFLFGYKAGSEAQMRPMLVAMRNSFQVNPPSGQAIVDYFALLHDGRYGEAARYYGGSYEVLQGWNPDVRANDVVMLWERGCTQNGLVCLVVRRVVSMQEVTSTEFRYVVEFSNEDGTLFRRGPCCGSTEEEMPTVWQFPYNVKKVGGRWLVQDMPVYIP